MQKFSVYKKKHNYGILCTDDTRYSDARGHNTQRIAYCGKLYNFLEASSQTILVQVLWWV